jgi:hypothetical protein
MRDRWFDNEIGFGPRQRDIRAADSDRERVGEILRQHHLEGRLDDEEFQQRLQQSLTARTYADLDRLLADLPVGGGLPQERPEHPRRYGFPGMRFGIAAVLTAAAIAASVLTGIHALWVAIPVFFFVVRPMMWRLSGGRIGGGPWGCRGRMSRRYPAAAGPWV